MAAILAIITFSGALVEPLLQDMIFGEPVKYVKPEYKIKDPITIMLPPTPEIKEPVVESQPAVKQKVKTAPYTATKIVPDDAPEPTRELATQEELKHAVIGTQSIDGEALDIPEPPMPPTPAAAGAGVRGTGTTEKAFLSVDQMPMFAGGDAALFKYLGNNINYPARAKQAGVEGLVVVTFVVAANGDIQDVTVLKGLGYGTDEEAMRVIEHMPAWTPGRQNGRAVPVRYTLPIRFNLK